MAYRCTCRRRYAGPPDEVRRRTLDELDVALRGAEARSPPAELAAAGRRAGTTGSTTRSTRPPASWGDLSRAGPAAGRAGRGRRRRAAAAPRRRRASPDWKDRALCAETDPEAFFPEKGGSTREAKRVCVSCEVRAECLDFALGNDERFGIWGGLSERERRRLKKRVV